MKSTSFVLAVLIAFVSFTLLDALLGTQLPIGVKSVKPIETSSHSNDDYLKDGKGAMHLVFTESTMSFVATQPLNYYSLPNFYSKNMVANIISSAILCLLLYFTRHLNMKKRLSLIFLFGLYSIFTIHASYWNWWGFSTTYTIGVSMSFILSLIVVSTIISKLFFRTPTSQLS